MLPCLLLLMFGIVVGETCDVVFQDSTHATDSVKECITSMVQTLVNKFEYTRKIDVKLIKSMEGEIENLKADYMVRQNEINQLKYANQKRKRHFLELYTEFTDREDIIESLQIAFDNITVGNGNMEDKLDFLSKPAKLQTNKRFEKSVLTPRTHRTPITNVPGDISASTHAPARVAMTSSSVPGITHVAFHAILANQVINPGNDKELSFEHVITNNGNYYSNDTGAFTANQPGTYVFTWEITATANQYVDTHLVKNGDVVGSIKTWGYYSSGSTSSGSAVLDLITQDVVLVRVGDHTNRVNILANYTMFSGFRLY